jgi:GT2 family glycosyltransferase
VTAVPRVAVVIPVHNDRERTLRCLESLARIDYAAHTPVIVDDGSRDGTAAAVAQRHPHATVLRGNGNLWWAGATNLGVRHALENGYDFVLTLNNDTQVDPSFLTYLVNAAPVNPRTIVGARINFLRRPSRIWALGATMRWRDGKIFHLLEQGQEETAPHLRHPELRPVETLTGCGALIPVDCFRETGYYDARRFPQYHADAEFVLRAAKHGWRALVHTRAVVYNDAEHTAADSTTRLVEQLLSRRSAAYLRPILAIHRDYCPPRLLLASLAQYYARHFLNRDERLRGFGVLLKALARRFRKPAGDEGTQGR